MTEILVLLIVALVSGLLVHGGRVMPTMVRQS